LTKSPAVVRGRCCTYPLMPAKDGTVAAAAAAVAARAVEKTAIDTRATAAAASAGGSSSGCINEELMVSRLRRSVGGDLVGGARAAAKGEVVLQAEQERLLFATDGSVVSRREVVVLAQALASDDRPATGCRCRLQRRRCCQCCCC
jgi:hypothetical protein